MKRRPSGRCPVKRARRGLSGSIATFALLLIGNRLEAQAADWQRSIQVGANAWYGAARTRVVATDLEVSRMDSVVTLRSDFHLGYADGRQGDAPRQVTARTLRFISRSLARSTRGT